MIFKQKSTMPRCILVYGVLVLFFLFTLFFLGCDLIQQFVAPVGTETPDSAVPVKIGFIYSPPDPGTTRNGAELAVALANEAGGINGQPIELLIKADQRDPLLSAQHAKELINASVSAIVGPDYDEEAVEVGAVAQQHGIPMVTTYPTNPKVTRNGNFSFMGAYTDPYQASVMAIVAVEPAVDVIFLAGLGSEFPVAVKQAKAPAIGITATFLGGDGWDRPDLVEIGGTAVEGSFFANHFSPGGPPERLSEAARQFITAYTARFGIAPDGPTALSYDSTTIVIEAMRRSVDMTPAAIRDQIEATQNYNGAIMLSHFDENRHAIKSLVINTVKDGKIQFHQAISP